jgi:tetratricopeptide (TPR) repeat protein
VEAWINLGTTLYQLKRLEEAKRVFAEAIRMEAFNPLAHFNHGCVLEQLGDVDAAIRSFLRAVELAPNLADAHLNLALAYDSRGEKQRVLEHLSLYLRYEPDGTWADFARARMRERAFPTRSSKLTPFRQKA